MVQVIQGKEKSNINKLIIVDCAANIFTLLLHTFIHTPLFKLRSDSMFPFINKNCYPQAPLVKLVTNMRYV